MMQRALIPTLSAVLIATMCAASAEYDSTSSEAPTHELETLVWESKREIREHLLYQADRVAASELIIESALNEPSLTDEQRVNGLMIASSTLINEGRYENAIAALEHIDDLSENPLTNARAHEWIARAVAGDGTGLGDARVLDAFIKSADLHLTIDPEAESPGTLRVFRKLVTQARRDPRREIGYEYVKRGADLFAPPEARRNEYGGYFLIHASQMAEEMGDTDRAIGYLDQLIEQYPDHQSEDLHMGWAPRFLVRRACLREGVDMAEPNGAVVEVMMRVINNPAYRKMPIIYNYGYNVAYHYRQRGMYDLSLDIMIDTAQRIESVLGDIEDTLANYSIRRALLDTRMLLYSQAANMALFDLEGQQDLARQLSLIILEEDRIEALNAKRMANMILDRTDAPQSP